MFPRFRWLLPACMTVSIGVFLLVTAWLLTDPATSRGDALKTGGLAGGAIVALYALWINDRRRRTEEARHEVERGRVQHDLDRVDNERFAKAVELLGHEADQVRVGALHALAGLARNRPSHTQTVLDVLCSYLRRPFTHPSYETRPGDPDQAEVGECLDHVAVGMPHVTWIGRVPGVSGRKTTRADAPQKGMVTHLEALTPVSRPAVV